MIAILNILVNSGLLYGLNKTGQLKRTSCKFIALVTLSDFLIGGVVQSLVAVVLTQNGSENCWLELSTQFIAWIFIEFSALMACLVALDRYLHMQYLMKYPLLMTKKRALVFVTLCALVAVALAIGSVVASNNNKAFTFYVISMMVCLPVPSVIVVLYFKAYRTVCSQVRPAASRRQASLNGQATTNTSPRANGQPLSNGQLISNGQDVPIRQIPSSGQATLDGQAATKRPLRANGQPLSNGQLMSNGQDVPIRQISSSGKATLDGQTARKTLLQANRQLFSNGQRSSNGQLMSNGRDEPVKKISSTWQATVYGQTTTNTPPQANKQQSSNGLLVSNSQGVPLGPISSRKEALGTFQHHRKFAKATKRILILLIFAWSPYTIVSCAWYYDWHFHKGDHVSMDILLWFSYLIIYSNSFFNGVIFISQNSPVKQSLRNIVFKESMNNTAVAEHRKTSVITSHV